MMQSKLTIQKKSVTVLVTDSLKVTEQMQRAPEISFLQLKLVLRIKEMATMQEKFIPALKSVTAPIWDAVQFVKRSLQTMQTQAKMTHRIK